MENRKRVYPVNMFRVCIDTEQGNISGRVYSPMSAEEIVFVGIGEMLLKIDKLFDSIGYPQAFQNRRSFQEVKDPGNAYRGIPEQIRESDSILDKEGEYYTYDIVVETRRNASWQGRVFDTQGVEQGRFNGDVELLNTLTELTKK